MAAANSLSVSAPFWCSATRASSSDAMPARSIGCCSAGASTTTPSTGSEVSNLGFVEKYKRRGRGRGGGFVASRREPPQLRITSYFCACSPAYAFSARVDNFCLLVCYTTLALARSTRVPAGLRVPCQSAAHRSFGIDSSACRQTNSTASSIHWRSDFKQWLGELTIRILHTVALIRLAAQQRLSSEDFTLL